MKAFKTLVLIIGATICLSSCSSVERSTASKSKTDLVLQNDSLIKANDSLTMSLKTTSYKLDSLMKAIQLPQSKYALGVDEMLNIEDATIFTDNFKPYEIKQVPPRSREMYNWVKHIHELDELMKEIAKEHQTIESYNANITNLPPSTVKQITSLNESVKSNIRKADKLRENIELSYNEMKKTFSSAQMKYYNDLTDNLNSLINIYF